MTPLDYLKAGGGAVLALAVIVAVCWVAAWVAPEYSVGLR